MREGLRNALSHFSVYHIPRAFPPFCPSEQEVISEARKVFDTLESFQAFQAALQAHHPEVPPTMATHLTLIGSTSDLL
jgi:hypothetical protein